jgi:glycosyltransferase involved in cell wall biosynthesis
VFSDKIDSDADIEVLYNPINLNTFNSAGRELNVSGSIKKIIYTGRLDTGKGLLNWIKCAVEIHKVHKDVTFEIYGDGNLKDLIQETIIKSNAESYIVLKGFIKNISEAYRNADLLIFLSEYESFGNVVVESILCGTPVLASDIPSMREIFRNFSGFLIPAGEGQEKAILDRLENYHRLRELCLEAAKEFRMRFSAQQHMIRLEKIYSNFSQV